MPAQAEVLHDGTIGGEEPLGVARGFEPLPALLPLAGRLFPGQPTGARALPCFSVTAGADCRVRREICCGKLCEKLPMKNGLYPGASPRALLAFFAALLLVLSVNVGACSREQRNHSPVTLQQNPRDGTAVKAVPVYPDERDEDARKRLLASVECSPYLVLDEGVSTWMFAESKAGENYYLYVKYQCPEPSVG